MRAMIRPLLVLALGAGISAHRSHAQTAIEGASQRLGAALTTAVGTGQQTYRERVDVSRVLIDVRVTDNSDKPITDLTAADFSVKIDGKAAPVDTIEWLAADHGPDADARSATSSMAMPARRGRWIVFLYEKKPDLSEVEGLMRLRSGFEGFAGLITNDDHVAILSFDTSLHYWLDFTSDVRRVRRVMEHDILIGSAPRVEVGPFPSLSARLSPERARSTYTVEKSLRLLGEALDPLPGAKTIIVLGYGMGTWVRKFNSVQMEHEYGEAFFALQKARVSVFCIDITRADYHPKEEGLRLIAEATGGFYMTSHIFTTAIFDKLAGALSGYYVLLVNPPDAQKGQRHIEVKLVRRKGIVIAKRAYAAE